MMMSPIQRAPPTTVAMGNNPIKTKTSQRKKKRQQQTASVATSKVFADPARKV